MRRYERGHVKRRGDILYFNVQQFTQAKRCGFEGAKGICSPCTQRERCLRTPQETVTRQVAFFDDKSATDADRVVQQMKQRIDSDEGKLLYGQRFATVEPVFGNIRANKRSNRFTYRGRRKINGQWLLFCLVHNIEKLANDGIPV